MRPHWFSTTDTVHKFKYIIMTTPSVFGKKLYMQLKEKSAVLVVLLVFSSNSLTVGCASNPQVSSAGVSLDLLRPMLNSERIQFIFGSYGIEVLDSNDSLRISNLYSVHDSKKICRTFAVVHYPKFVAKEFSKEHNRILAGQSIGAVFKQNGWDIDKQHRYFGVIRMRPEFGRVRSLMGSLPTNQLAIHIYVLTVTRSGTSYDYATITEVHHPNYLTIMDLTTIYGKEVSIHSNVDKEIGRMLDVVYQKMTEGGNH